jgi:vitamin B12 transport system substrate-binding protein
MRMLTSSIQTRAMPNIIGSLLLLGASLHANAAIERIISLSPHATELAFAAGLGDKMIAVTEYSDYPEEAKKLERVANYQGIKLEKILTLKPDLVITWPDGNPARELEKLKSMGVATIPSNIRSIDDIATGIEQLSQYADDPSIGLNNAKQFRLELTQLRARYQHVIKVRYFYQLSEKPIITLAKESWPSEVFSVCGGENIFAHSPSPYPQVGIEQVLLAKPEVIFTSEHAINNGNMWDRWKEIPAISHHYVWSLNSDWINRPTPRTLLAIKEVCQHFDYVRQNH